MCIPCFIIPAVAVGVTLLSASLLFAQAVAVTVFARLLATPVIVQDKENKDEEATIDVDTTPIATITHAQLPANPDKRKKKKNNNNNKAEEVTAATIETIATAESTDSIYR
mmetsp:Transcript_32260/g.78465  ORF Transcript_32260/g.78465 Transcript_32260/m.78465 type:complete len:111 (+) Transcript_32260:198-530(+)